MEMIACEGQGGQGGVIDLPERRGVWTLAPWHWRCVLERVLCTTCLLPSGVEECAIRPVVSCGVGGVS